jgi:hypothetical protein
MNPPRRDSPYPTHLKMDLVLRLLGGESIAALSRETGRPRKQLSVWRRRFLAGGEVSLDSRPDQGEIEALRSARDELSRKVGELESENQMLKRRAAFLDEARSGRSFSHPYCSEAYSQALEEPDSQALAVPDWGTHVLVRKGPGGKKLAVGARPFAALDPGSDLQAGLDHLRDAGITSVSLVTDPLWGPEPSALQEAFDVCHRFKETYLVDKAAGPAKIGKRHRNRINKARSTGELREISLAENLDTWLELYSCNVANRQIPQPFSTAYFERLAEFPELLTTAVLVAGEIVTITTWVPYRDTLYFHDAASNAKGHAASASYVAFADVVENFADCRYLFLGGSADFYDDRLDGLARFKRGFANRSNVSYLCSAILKPAASHAVAA